MFLQAGKTTWIENLIESGRMNFRPKTIIYHYPVALRKAPVVWDEKFPDIQGIGY